MNFDALENKKINIVCSGGEMKGGFVSGLLGDMFEQVDMDKFQITFYCVSASVPSMLYYLSYGKNTPRKQIWVDDLSQEAKKIKNGFFKIDINGIINIFKKYPFIPENIFSSRHEIIFAIYNIDKKKIELVSSKKRPGYKYLGDYDIYEIVKAAISAPLIYGRSVHLDGFDYCDPGLVNHFIFPENKNKTIFVLQNKNFRRDKFVSITFLAYSFFNQTKIPYFKFAFSLFHKHKFYKLVKTLVKSGNSLLLEPKNRLQGEITRPSKKRELLFNFKQGQKVFWTNKAKIENFLLK